MELSERVRLRREELGLSQEDLAARMGYSSRSSINKIEKGRPCSQKIIARLAEALNVRIPYLMGWEDEMEKNPVGMAERHIEILMDEDLSEIFDDFKKLDATKRKIVKDLVHSLAETKKAEV
ncbi:MAG: helix-turn-helix transcriptional regulator [Ruminococcus sp.]|nr:helix-turn-helix transcriptional regulator [Ruminococcus sp.]